MGSLDDIIVLEVAEGLAGPFCGQLLAEAGARVIKVERMDGDPARGYGPPFAEAYSSVFACLNRGKESIALDLSTRRGGELLRKLGRFCDVVVESLVPGEGPRAFVDYRRLERYNPHLIYCAINDFSEEGTWSDVPGAELVYQGLTDYLNSLGQQGEPPVRVGADIGEMSAGLFGFLAVLGAVYDRLRSGKGQKIEMSKVGSLMSLRSIIWAALSNPDSWFGGHCDNYAYPREHGIRTKDGSVYLILRPGSEESFDNLTIRLGMEWVAADPRFAEGGRQALGFGRYAAEVKHIWEEAFNNYTSEEVLDLIRAHNGDGMPLLDYPSLVTHPQVEAAGIFEEVEYPSGKVGKVVGAPWTFSDGSNPVLGRAPLLGEHADSILAMLGYSLEQGRHLRKSGVLP